MRLRRVALEHSLLKGGGKWGYAKHINGMASLSPTLYPDWTDWIVPRAARCLNRSQHPHGVVTVDVTPPSSSGLKSRDMGGLQNIGGWLGC